MMKKYIVGGWVRDTLLGLKPNDRDFVIVGATASDVEYLLSIGYTQVGKDFPVFLSPEGEEYALARIERKVGLGYTGFEAETEGVSLKQDLSRRDLTINAIAYDPILEVYTDPFGGRKDLSDKILRHTSSAFSEDPLRVLRLARFYARLDGFIVHSSTKGLATVMVSNNELDQLSNDRIFMEFRKAFNGLNPCLFLAFLHSVGYLQKKLPEVNFLKIEQILDSIYEKATPAFVETFFWTKMLEGKNIPKNHRYEGLPLPVEIDSFINFMTQHGSNVKKLKKMKANEATDFLLSVNFKNKGGEDFLYKVTEYMILTGQLNQEDEDYILKLHDAFYSVEIPDVKKLVKEGKLKNEEIKSFVKNYHLEAVTKFLS